MSGRNITGLSLGALVPLALRQELYFSLKTHGDRPGAVTVIMRDQDHHKLEVSGTLAEALAIASVWLELHGHLEAG